MEKLRALERSAKFNAENWEPVTVASTNDILAIAEAFRALEQRAEAAEAHAKEWRKKAMTQCAKREVAESKLAELGRREPVAWVFEDDLLENYPYDAMYPYSKVDVVRFFPVFGPAPAVSLSELVPVLTRLKNRYICNEGSDLEFIACVTPERSSIGTGGSWDDWRELSAILRKIEEAK